jgi:AcrR family transcriptional regulator
MADVADAAGVSRATVFNHFGSKHALVEAVTETVYEGYQSILDNAVADRQTPVPVLVRSLFEIMGHGIELDRRFYRTVFRELARVTVGLDEGSATQQARQRAVERLVHLLTRGQARGELAASFDAQDLAVAFDSLVFGTIAHWLYDDASEPLNERMLRTADIFLRPVATIDADTYDGPLPDLRVPPSPKRREP